MERRTESTAVDGTHLVYAIFSMHTDGCQLSSTARNVTLGGDVQVLHSKFSTVEQKVLISIEQV